VQVTEGSLAKTSCSELEELASSELEDSWESEEPGTSTDEELSASALDKGSVSEEPGSASRDDELVGACSEEVGSADEEPGVSGSFISGAVACVVESLPQLAQNRDATDTQHKRQTLRIFIESSYFPIIYNLFAMVD
jgi:hypothetical protein